MLVNAFQRFAGLFQDVIGRLKRSRPHKARWVRRERMAAFQLCGNEGGSPSFRKCA